MVGYCGEATVGLAVAETCGEKSQEAPPTVRNKSMIIQPSITFPTPPLRGNWWGNVTLAGTPL